MTDNPLAPVKQVNLSYAEALLKDVPIRYDLDPVHDYVRLDLVVSTLSAALTLPDDEAGKVLERLTTVGFGYDLTTDDKAAITRLIAQRAADVERIRELEAERDQAREWLGAANNEFGSATWDWPDLWHRIASLKELSNERWQRAKAAEARADRLVAALREILAREYKAWMPMRIYRTAEQTSLDDAAHDAWVEAAQIARAAITEAEK